MTSQPVRDTRRSLAADGSLACFRLFLTKLVMYGFPYSARTITHRTSRRSVTPN
jgi:hypothetical protein